ncbi:3'-5' exonuclease [uncultured Clostridium sp.]|uniref:3'-5' exonuclease n=1 Tax=uncultured Clostridium sp. TaxID=59620 RepID=UPI00272C2AEA|nr:3'-5' exonuclease [uncultured Clostridium sp.]
MAFIIIDLEFNNLSGIHKCIPNVYNEYPNLKKLDLSNEIIEIGAVKLDSHMQPCEELKVFIKPSVIPVINPKILDITKINIKDIENGVHFIEGLNKLKCMVNEGDIICSWAKDDIVEIIKNANYYGYSDLSWIKNYLDIQEYVTKILGYKKSLSLKNALKALKIKVNEGTLHDALNDAIYTAHVFKNLYNSRAIKKYIIEDVYNMPALEVTSLDGIELNYDKINQMCPKCQKKIEVDYPFSPVGWRFISLGTCTKCNSRILNELIVRKSLCGEEIYKEVATVIDEYDYLRYENKLKHKVYN